LKLIYVQADHIPRLVWPGDLAIGIPSIFASTYDFETLEVSLDALFAEQNTTTGMLPYAGTAPFSSIYSPTYHLYSLIDAAYIYLYTYVQQSLFLG